MLIGQCKALIVSIFLLLGFQTMAGNVNLNFFVEGDKHGDLELKADRLYLGDQTDELTKKLVDGKLELDFSISKPLFMDVNYKKRTFRIYIEPNYQLNISFPAKGKGTVGFSGKGSDANQLYQDFNAKFADQFDIDYQASQSKKNDIDAFEMNLFNSRREQSAFVENHPSYKTISEDFKKFWKHQNSYNYHFNLLNYVLLGNDNAKSIDKLPSAIHADIKKQKVNSPNALISSAYRNFLHAYFDYQVWKKHDYKWENSKSDFIDASFLQATTLLKGEIKRYFLAKEMIDHCSEMQKKTYEKWSKALRKMDGKRFYYSAVYFSCAENAGKTSKQVVAKAEKTKKAKTKKKKKKKNKKNKIPERSIEEVPYVAYDLQDRLRLLEDFEGKVVYLDFWATWCRPCTNQFPHAKKLKEQLSAEIGEKGMEEVVFLYISIDRNKEAWKKGIEKYELQSAENFFSPGGWKATVTKKFGIRSIPRYMLINRKGEIVDKNAPRPQQTKQVIAKIKTLLGES